MGTDFNHFGLQDWCGRECYSPDLKTGMDFKGKAENGYWKITHFGHEGLDNWATLTPTETFDDYPPGSPEVILGSTSSRQPRYLAQA